MEKIKAIKHVRETTGLGLKESKELVESLQQFYSPSLPNALSKTITLEETIDAFKKANTILSKSSNYSVVRDAKYERSFIVDAEGVWVPCYFLIPANH